MVYPDKPGRRIRRPLRPTPPAATNIDEAKIRYIREVAAKHPRFTPDEVYAEIRYGRRRHDITKAMVRQVLAQRRRTRSQRPFDR